MPYNMRSPDGGGPAMAHQYPVTRTYALVLLGAVALLVLMHRLFGSITIEAGAR